MAFDIRRVRVEIKLALSSVYAIRTHTPHKNWTEEQAETIVRIEHDLVALQESLKGGWADKGCPTCGAQPDEVCVTPRGNARNDHRTREWPRE